MFLEDQMDHEWNSHFFVLTQNKLFYTDICHCNQEADEETDVEDEVPNGPAAFIKQKEVKLPFKIFHS